MGGVLSPALQVAVVEFLGPGPAPCASRPEIEGREEGARGLEPVGATDWQLTARSTRGALSPAALSLYLNRGDIFGVIPVVAIGYIRMSLGEMPHSSGLARQNS